MVAFFSTLAMTTRVFDANATIVKPLQEFQPYTYMVARLRHRIMPI